MIKLIPGKQTDKFEYLKKMRTHATERWAFLNWLTPCERACVPLKTLGVDTLYPSYEVVCTTVEQEMLQEHKVFHVALVEGKLFDKVPCEDIYAVYAYLEVDTKPYLILLQQHASQPPFTFAETMYIKAGDIDNYHGGPILTDVGKYLVNQIILADPFGDKIPYMNTKISPAATDKAVAKLITSGEIGRKEYDQYMRNGYWFGSDAGVTTVTMTEKAMVTNPEVEKRRKELLEQHKDELDNPQVTVAIEQELIKMDKDWIKSDESYAFYDADGGKVFKEQRKKMHLMFGTGIAFDKDTNKYTFYGKPLSEGWDPKSISICANDTRRGSYGRGIDTAKGGEQTKFLLRVFQEVSIIEDDCGSKQGIKVFLTENIASQYFGRYLISGAVLTKDNYKDYLDSTVEIRSPLHCKTEGGFCYQCCGKSMRDIGMKSIGMQAIRISSRFTSTSMKSVHSSSARSVRINDFLHFLV